MSEPWYGPKIYRVCFAWEAVIYWTPHQARSSSPGRPSQIDWCMAAKGHHTDVEGTFLGAKPLRYCFWLFRLLGLGGHADDELVDLFPGSGAVTRAWQDYQAREVTRRCGAVQGSLFAEGA